MKVLDRASYAGADDGIVRLDCAHGHTMAVQVLEPDIARVTLHRPGGYRLDRTWCIAPGGLEPPLAGRDRDSRAGFACPAVTVSDGADQVSIASAGLRIVAHTDPLRLEWFRAGEDAPFAADRPAEAYTVSRRTPAFAHHMVRRPGERHYGVGDKAGALDRTGRRFRMQAVDPMGFDAETSDPLYKVMPVYLTVDPGTGAAYGVLYDSLGPAELDFGCTLDNYFGPFRSYRAEDGDLDVYMIAGPSVAEVVARLSWLTGGQALPPKWSLGFGLTSMSLADAPDADARIAALIDDFRRTGIACDSFHFGSGYTIRNGRRYVFTWNRDKFPDPTATVDRLRAGGLRTVANVKPCLLDDHPAHDQAAEAGLFVRDGDTGRPVPSQFWDGVGGHLDFTHPKAAAWWCTGMQGSLLDHGIDSLWNDNNEYGVWDEDAVCDGAGRPFPLSAARPVQALLMTKLSRDRQAAHRPDERPYVITRAGPVGLGRYGQTWTGDNRTDWKTLRFNLQQGLSLALSGAFNVGHDVGGFAGPSPDPELLVRFTQFCALWPRFVMNSWKDTGVVTLPWMHGQVLDEMRAAIALRYRLMPALYTAMWRAAAFNAPPVRPLFYQFPGDPLVADCADAFMLGPNLLVAPVLEPGARSRKVALPEASCWVDFHSGTPMRGGAVVEIDAPLDRLPVLVRCGSALPLSRQLAPLDPATDRWRGLRIYLEGGGAEAWETTLYEDDGTAVDWANGGSCRITVHVQADSREIVLSASSEGAYRPAFDRLEVEIASGREGRPVMTGPRAVNDGGRISLRFR